MLDADKDKPDFAVATYSTSITPPPTALPPTPNPPLPTPDFLFATAKSKNSNRPVETITPLASALKLVINDTYNDDTNATSKDSTHDIDAMVKLILGNSTYTGKTILICWHHGNNPYLAQQLGATAPINLLPPNKWPGTVFDRVWLLDFTKRPLVVQDDPQNLLCGDSAT